MLKSKNEEKMINYLLLFTITLVVIVITVTTMGINTTRLFGHTQDICHITSISDAFKKCEDGDTVMFLPSIYGNDQLPLTAAAAFCDFSKPVIWNTGGVSCVFTSERAESWQKIINEEK